MALELVATAYQSTEYDFKVKTEDEVLKNADALVILTKQEGIIFDDFEHMKKIMNDKLVVIGTKNVIYEIEAKKCEIKWWRI